MHLMPRPEDVTQPKRLYSWVEDSEFTSVTFGSLEPTHPEVFVSHAAIGDDLFEIWFGPRGREGSEVGRWCRVNGGVHRIETGPRDMGIRADAIRGSANDEVRDHLRLLLFIHATMEPFFQAQRLAGPQEMMLEALNAIAARAITVRDERKAGYWHPES